MAAECSPGRKPGDHAILEFSRALEEGDRIVGGIAQRSICRPSGALIHFVIGTPGLRPGLHSAARWRGLIESVL
jgi:hypothetical protein